METERQTPSGLGLRWALTVKEMSQAELARKIGSGEASVSRWVNGLRPGPGSRKKISRVLKIAEEEIWGA